MTGRVPISNPQYQLGPVAVAAIPGVGAANPVLAVGSVDGRIYAFGDVARFYRRDPPMDKFQNDRDVPI